MKQIGIAGSFVSGEMFCLLSGHGGILMRVYLDMCCYNRPYDPQDQIVIALETQAKLQIQKMIKENSLELVGSWMLDYEVSCVPVQARREAITAFIRKYEKYYVKAENQKVIEKAEEIQRTNIKEKDSIHVAAALQAHCDFFISTDKRLLKYKTDEIKMVTPIEFLMEMEEMQ